MTRRTSLAWALALLGAGAALPSPAASRARYGGALRAVLARPALREDPALADAPEDAALSMVVAAPPCRLAQGGRAEPMAALDLVRDGPLRLRVALPQGAHLGAPTPAALAERWERLGRAASLSPYRALLAPLRQEGRQLASGAAPGALELTLAFPWPDLEASLCHPALGIPGPGPFAPAKAPGAYLANAAFAQGRPFFDRLTVAAASDREAERLFALSQVELVLGATAGEEPPQAAPALYATYLAFRASRAGPELRAQLEATLDRADLARFFVAGPAVPMTALLPPALMPQPAAARAAAPAPAIPRELTLIYDQGLEDQRAVAERLQVKLHDRGYKVALRPLSRAELRATWARGDFDLMLHAVLLPPLAAPALAVVLDVAGRHDLLGSELPPLGAIADGAAREAAARVRAEALRPSLSVIPLYAQALRISASPRVLGLGDDAFGLPALDAASFGP